MSVRRLTPPLVIALIASLLTLAVTTAQAAAPSNDDFANATPMTLGVEIAVDLTEASSEAGETFDCGDDGAESVWFTFTAPADGDYAFYTTDTNFDSALGLFSDFSTGISCDDDESTGHDSFETHTMTSGDTVYMQVAPLDAAVTGSGLVGVVALAPPADDIGDAVPVTAVAGTTTALGAFEGTALSRETNEPYRCGGHDYASPDEDDAPTAWITFTPSETGTWYLSTRGEDQIDFNVYRGTSLADIELLHCASGFNDDVVEEIGPAIVGLMMHLQAGVTYPVQLVDTTDNAEPFVFRAERSSVRSAQAEVVDPDGAAYGGTNDVGDHSSMTVLPDGRPIVAYHVDEIGELRVAVREAPGVWVSERVDRQGAGSLSSDIGEYPDIAILANGRPGIAYHDDDNDVLLFVEQEADGSWGDSVIVDADGEDIGDEAIKLAVVDGQPAIAYSDEIAEGWDEAEVRYAQRNEDGTWTTEVVDDTATSLGSRISLTVLDGQPVIAYNDYETTELRVAERQSDGSWDIEVIDEVGQIDTDDSRAVAIAALPTGELVLATGNAYGRPTFAHRTVGGDWTVEFWNDNTELSRRMDVDDTDTGHLLVADDGTVHYVYGDDDMGSIAVVTRTTAGVWTQEEMVSRVTSPHYRFYWGYLNLVPDSFGATLLNDGRIAVVSEDDWDDWLWYAEDSLKADAGPDQTQIAGGNVVVNGGASFDRGGAITSFTWDGPETCAIATPSAVSTTVSCTGLEEHVLTLTVTDHDGHSHSDEVTVGVVPPDCGERNDPFLDVTGAFELRRDVNCIWNVGVTTGTSPTTYTPGGLVTREQMASFLARLYRVATGDDSVAPASPFTDIDASTHKANIDFIYDLGLTNGTSATTYSPYDTVTREQMAAFLIRLIELVTDEQAPLFSTNFDDIGGSTFIVEIGKLKSIGITNGTSASTFSPTDNLTRAQMASFLARTYRLLSDES